MLLFPRKEVPASIGPPADDKIATHETDAGSWDGPRKR